MPALIRKDGDVIELHCDCDMVEDCARIVDRLLRKHAKGDSVGYTFDCPLKLIRVKRKEITESESPHDVKIVESGNEEEE